jgi:hypothetical protein
MNRSKIILTILIAATMASACGASSEPILSVTGLTDKTYTKKELMDFSQVESAYMNKDGEITKYMGIPIISIIENCEVETYSSMTMVASDGYSVEITHEELDACNKCIIAFQENDGLLAVMPDFSSKLQVRDLIKLQIH